MTTMMPADRNQDSATMVTQYGLERHFFGQRFAQLQLGKYRGLVQPATQVNREQAKHTPQQERDTPGVISDFGGGVKAVDRGSNQ